MTQKETLGFLSFAIESSLRAGKEILQVYSTTDFGVQLKEDRTPLTLADQMANKVITDILNSTGLPVLSEEGKHLSFEERSKWDYYWLVDPLDGTKEFINRNGEFTVNIALIKKDSPVAGVIYIPVQKKLYISEIETGAFCIENICADFAGDFSFEKTALKGRKMPYAEKNEKMVVVGSRSHMNAETEVFIQNLRDQYGELEFQSKGSSLKICMVAEGNADIYPRFGPTMEWDTAAGHAIALGAGCSFTLKDGQTPIKYNKKELLNDWFIVRRKP
ncbi:MAG: 3'(2'),5'-bisphosphate nucleotidase [Bacteroidetes bacterium GWF2_38_335]|nr:MAG: 3'(2'),5'-bisphosphate nucleotidase [Bacteroidetes bacterium GWF2_38_335]OFY80705.1 MAG: 3'(2'),5'-bisphosphate nucleotidase [Bacteroidetes bacterium RIFOXYA12_FULL_38_20]HBS87053.1 3'(2'),5'-bisphosphate nucleotidase [Bacteroidales bacterium]